MLPQKIVMTLKIFLYLNIMTLTKLDSIKMPHKNKSLSISHVNAHYLNKYFDDL